MRPAAAAEQPHAASRRAVMTGGQNPVAQHSFASLIALRAQAAATPPSRAADTSRTGNCPPFRQRAAAFLPGGKILPARAL